MMKASKLIYGLLMSVLILMSASCGKDSEDDYVDSYYMTIQSQVSLNISDDEDQGTMSEGKNDVLSKTITSMKKALLNATSEKNSRQVNDAAAIRVCDSIYNAFVTAYADKKGPIVCYVKVIRSNLVDGLALNSYTLKTYHFWVVEVDPDPTPTEKIEKPECLAPVDLGLSVLWANCNFGSKTVDGNGGHYAWGDPTGKLWSGDGIRLNLETSIYSWNTNNYGGNNPPSDISGTALDIVAANWGDGWRMPTYNEAKELCEQCQWKLHESDGAKWCEVIGPNGNSIIMPLAGLFGDDLSNRFHAGPYRVGERGYYWTSTSCTTPGTAEERGYGVNEGVITAWIFRFNSNVYETAGLTPVFADYLRAFHISIRAVHNK